MKEDTADATVKESIEISTDMTEISIENSIETMTVTREMIEILDDRDAETTKTDDSSWTKSPFETRMTI